MVNDASSSNGLLFTQQQVEQLALLMPQLQQQTTKESDTDEELEMHFSGMISSDTSFVKNDWIIDSGASDHMTACLDSLNNVVPVAKTHQIKLPTRDSVLITHTGNVNVIPGLFLKNVLCVPTFQHNLLSVQKLIKDNNCSVQFTPTQCLISDATTHKLIGI